MTQNPALADEGELLRAALERKEQLCLLLEGLLESLADGMVALDFRGRPVHVSRQLRDLHAAAEPDDSPAALERVLPREVLSRLRREIRQCPPGRACRFDLEWDRPEAGTKQYRVVGAAGSSMEPREPGTAGAESAMTVLAFHDRTREANLEEELARARNLAALGQMAATVAHELRNPLGAIQGFATLLERDLAGQEGSLRQVDRILRGVESANRIVGDLLEYCRPLHPRREPIPLDSLLQESLASLRAGPRWSEEVTVDLAVEPELPPCLGDRALLLQVFGNLYQNAIDAMGGRGTLAIRARTSGPSLRPDRLRVVVRDSGCGLTAEEVAQIFAPFYSTKPGGTGLGLALVRKIMEAHGGHVHVVSTPERGSSIVLDLPAAGEEIAPRDLCPREAA